MNKPPIFAFGSGRSGTTLLAKLLDSSKSILYRHEPDKLYPNHDIPFLPEPEVYHQYAEQARKYIEELTQVRAASANSTPPYFEKSFRTALANRVRPMLVRLYIGLERLRTGLDIPDLARTDDFTYLIKSVNSTVRAPLLAKALPDMKFIHIVRHPGAVVASLVRGIEKNLMKKWDFVDDVAKLSVAPNYGVNVDEIHGASFEEQHTYVWMLQNDKVYSELKDYTNYMIVSYEDLCVNMKARLEEMCDFIGIQFDSQMRNFVDLISQADSSSSYFSVIRNPVSSLFKWEDNLHLNKGERIATLIKSAEVGRFTLEKYAQAKKKVNRAG